MQHKTCAVLSLLTGRLVPHGTNDTESEGLSYLYRLMSYIAGAPVASHMLMPEFRMELSAKCAPVVSADIVAFAQQVKMAEKSEFLDAALRFCEATPECEVGEVPAMSEADFDDAFWRPLADKTLVFLEKA